jgi:hypothetical protein
MSLGWVLVLRYGVAVGRAFGGSDDVGRVVLFTVYLLLVQVTVLVGYLLVLSVDAHLAPPRRRPTPRTLTHTPKSDPHFLHRTSGVVRSSGTARRTDHTPNSARTSGCGRAGQAGWGA